MFFFVLLMVIALWSAWRTVALVRTDGHGDVPAPRSHEHEYVAPWRA